MAQDLICASFERGCERITEARCVSVRISDGRTYAQGGDLYHTNVFGPCASVVRDEMLILFDLPFEQLLELCRRRHTPRGKLLLYCVTASKVGD